LFFFFQAEDGIRDFHVTGVQTCALPIWGDGDEALERVAALGEAVGELEGDLAAVGAQAGALPLAHAAVPGVAAADADEGERAGRSEERRVGKECSSRGAP